MANSTEPRTRRSREEQPRKSQIVNRKSKKAATMWRLYGRITLHFYKLPHHHALGVAEADHIEAGGEVGDIDLGDRLVAFAGKHRHAGDVGHRQRALRVVRALELHVEGVACGVGVEFH